jgi:hypothetical protein
VLAKVLVNEACDAPEIFIFAALNAVLSEECLDFPLAQASNA